MSDEEYRFVRVTVGDKGGFREFFDFATRLYEGNTAVHNYQLKVKGVLEAFPASELYLVEKTDKTSVRAADRTTVARFALCSNERLVDDSGKPYGHLGFIELIDDVRLFATIMDFARDRFKDLNFLLFPFFYSTWYDYRLEEVTKDFFSFFMEPPVKPYYHGFIDGYGFDESYLYQSARSFDLEGYLASQAKSCRKATEAGITIRDLDKSDLTREMEIIYDLSLRSFADNLFYDEISFDDFSRLYSSFLKILDPETVFFAMADGKEVGFLVGPPDFTPQYSRLRLDSFIDRLRFFFSRKKVKGIMIKTVAVVPEYRGKGIMGLLCSRTARIGKRRGYDYIMFAYYYCTNVSKKAVDPGCEKNYYLYRIKV